MNPFELFDIPVSFFPDLNDVRIKYYELSRLYHPDLQGITGQDEGLELLKKSSELNHAYRVLNAFDLRVNAILSIFNLMNDDDKSSVSPAFLMDMMDVNESLMEAKMEEDSQRLESIKIEVSQLQEELKLDWEAQCRQFDTRKDESLLTLIKDYYFRNKYLLRLQEQFN